MMPIYLYFTEHYANLEVAGIQQRHQINFYYVAENCRICICEYYTFKGLSFIKFKLFYLTYPTKYYKQQPYRNNSVKPCCYNITTINLKIQKEVTVVFCCHWKGLNLTLCHFQWSLF